VQIVRGESAPAWLVPDDEQPAYRVKALAGTRLCPSTRALELEVLGRDVATARLNTGLHQYCYVLGPDPVRFTWEHGGTTAEHRLDPGDSLYLKPFVPHGFTLTDVGRCAVLALRIGGKISGDTRREAAALGRPTLRRLAVDTGQWYDPDGGSIGRRTNGRQHDQPRTTQGE
jgi:methylphosphonate synthase